MMDNIQSIEEKIRFLEAEILDLKKRIKSIKNKMPTASRKRKKVEDPPDIEELIFDDDDMPWLYDHGHGSD
jgi:uncharacterized coiled-coil DUF342 family protein